MPHLLDGLLPEPAASLYQKLLGAGKLRLAEYPELADSDELRVLIDRGFARHRHVGEAVIVPIEPMRAIENALLVTQRRILEQHRMLVRVLEQVATLHQAYVSGGAEPEDAGSSIQVLVDPAEIGALSTELCLSAQRDVSNLETGQFRRVPDPRSARVPPKDVVDRGVEFRTVYARAALDVPRAAEMFERCAAGGWRQRILTELPMKMVLVDERAALLPLDPTGMDGAVLIRAPVILAMLRSYFEMLWRRAVPLEGKSDTKLNGVQDRVLRLMLTGATDAAVARHLGISERTVRRHVSTLLELLGTDNRVTAAVVAVRDGWID